jgi:hypothetical protein
LDVVRVRIEVHQQRLSKGNREAKQYMEEAEAEYENIEKMPRQIGMTQAGSGLRTEYFPKYATGQGSSSKGKEVVTFRTLLDWALVQITDANKRNLVDQMPNVRPPTLHSTNLVPQQWCDSWSTFDVEKEEVYGAKYGRTTGWTLGKINAALLYINPKEDKDISGVYGLGMDEPARCFGVANRKSSEDFLWKGDSGSVFVHDGSGAWLGLLYGLSPCGLGYMIPMDIIVTDIKKVTGCQVREPVYKSKS